MKKYFVYAAFLLLPLLFAGCLRTYYPVGYHTSAQPLVYQSHDKEIEFVGGDILYSNGSYEGEDIYLFRGVYNLVNTSDHFSANRRIFGYAGYYKVNGVEEFDGAKSTYALGGEFSVSPNFKIGQFKMGIGFNVGAFGEIGEYFEYVKRADSEGKIDGYSSLFHFYFSAFPVFHINSRNLQYYLPS